MAGVEVEKIVLDVIINGKKAGATANELRASYRKLNAQIKNLTPGTDKFIKKSAELRKVKARLKEVNEEIRGTESGFKRLTKALGPVGSLILGAFALSSLIAYGRKIIEITSAHQKYKAVLENTLGTVELANAAYSQIQDFAKNTPFQFDELIASYVKLVNQGFKPTNAEMTKLGDLAAAMGKDFDQLTEALIDAQVGEFERLKEFGVRAKKEGDKVHFTFKGVKTTVDFTADSIQDYVLSLGAAEGVTGGMAKISETLGGKISNLQDNVDSLSVTLGNSSSGFLTGAIDALNDFLDLVNMAAKTTEQIRQENWFNALSESAQSAVEDFDAYLKRLDELTAEAGKTTDVEQAYTNFLAQLQTTRNNFLEQGNDEQVEMLDAQIKAVEEHYRQLTEKLVGPGEKKRAEKILKGRQKLQEQIDALREKEMLSRLKDDERELAEQVLKFQKLMENEFANEEQKEAIRKLREEALKKLKEEQAEEDLEEFNKKMQLQNEQADTIHTALLSENEQELLVIDQHYEELYRMADELGMDTKEIQVKHAQDLNKALKKIDDDRIKKIEETKEKQFAIEQAKQQASQQFMDDLTTIYVSGFAILAKSQDDAARAIKIATLAQLAFDTANAIGSLTKGASAVSAAVAASSGPAGVVTGPSTYFGYYSAGLATILANVASAKQIMSNFADGGHTGTLFGSTPDSTGEKPVGIVHEQEWVSPKWMTNSPLYANTIAMLEHARSNDIGRYAQGGQVEGRGQQTPAPTNVPDFSGSSQLNTQILYTLTLINKQLENGFKTIIDQDALLELEVALDENKSIQNESNIS